MYCGMAVNMQCCQGTELAWHPPNSCEAKTADTDFTRTGGGMHHAHRDDGDGWCPFDDIMLSIRHVRRATAGAVQKVMVVDLDAHQGNGIARDKLNLKDDDLFILDAYNCRTYPGGAPQESMHAAMVPPTLGKFDSTARTAPRGDLSRTYPGGGLPGQQAGGDAGPPWLSRRFGQL